DEAQVRLDHLLLGPVVATLDPLREPDLLGGGQQLDASDVLEEELKGIRRGLERVLLRLGVVGVVRRGDDLDLLLLECLARLVALAASELQVVDRGRDLLGGPRPALATRLEKTLCLVGLEEVFDPSPRCLSPAHPHPVSSLPPSVVPPY